MVLGLPPPRGSATGPRTARDPGGTKTGANQPENGGLLQAASCWNDAHLVESTGLASKGRLYRATGEPKQEVLGAVG